MFCLEFDDETVCYGEDNLAFLPAGGDISTMEFSSDSSSISLDSSLLSFTFVNYSSLSFAYSNGSYPGL